MKSSHSVVLDTSAVVRLYIPDGPLPVNITQSLESAEQGEIDLISPELMNAEFYQVILKKEAKGYINSQEAYDILESFKDLPVTYLSHKILLPRAQAIAKKFNTTIYDGLFLSLAEKTKSKLISADDLIINIANKLS